MPFTFFSPKAKDVIGFTEYFNKLFSSFYISARTQDVSYLVGNISLYITLGANIGLQTIEYDRQTTFIITVTGSSLYIAFALINSISGAVRDLKENEIKDILIKHLDLFSTPPTTEMPNRKLSFSSLVTLFTKPETNRPDFSPPPQPIIVSSFSGGFAASAEEQSAFLPPTAEQLAVDKVTKLQEFLRRR